VCKYVLPSVFSFNCLTCLRLVIMIYDYVCNILSRAIVNAVGLTHQCILCAQQLVHHDIIAEHRPLTNWVAVMLHALTYQRQYAQCLYSVPNKLLCVLHGKHTAVKQHLLHLIKLCIFFPHQSRARAHVQLLKCSRWRQE